MKRRLSYLAGLAAIAAGGALAGVAFARRAYRRGQAVRFDHDGATYVRHADGSFTGIEGAPVISPQLEAVRAYWARTRSGG